MRGKAVLRTTFSQKHRITPAYAGKSVSFEKLPSVNKDHPRLCGEKELLPAVLYIVLGSPPPMRGKVTAKLTAGQTYGITPAYAGKR